MRPKDIERTWKTAWTYITEEVCLISDPRQKNISVTGPCRLHLTANKSLTATLREGAWSEPLAGFNRWRSTRQPWFAAALQAQYEWTVHGCSKGTLQLLGGITRGITSRDTGIFISLYSALAGPHLEYCAQFWAWDTRRSRTGRVQRKTAKMSWGLGRAAIEERLGKLGLFSLEKSSLREGLSSQAPLLGGWLQRRQGLSLNRSHREKGELMGTKHFWEDCN